MRRTASLVLLAACGGKAAPVARPVAARPAPAPTLELARPTETHFTNTGLAFYGAMLQPATGYDGYGRALHPATIDQSLAPHSSVTVADVECHVENLQGKPPRATCTNRRAHPSGDAVETAFRERLAACLRVTPVPLSPATLRAIETTLPRGGGPPSARPAANAQFVLVATDARVTEPVAVTPQAPLVFDDGCKGVPHPCDPGPRRLVTAPPTGLGKVATRVAEHHAFDAYGPEGYAFDAATPTSVPLFRQTGTAVLYGAPMLEGQRPDPRFVVQRFAYPKFSWEPPTNVSPAAARETAERIGAIALEHENEATELALVVDRAVLAWALGDAAGGKQRVHELDAWASDHPRSVPKTADMEHTLESLHALARGAFSLQDPCGK